MAVRRIAGVAVLGSSTAFAAYQLYWQRRHTNALVVPADLHSNQEHQIEALYASLRGSRDSPAKLLSNRDVKVFQFATCPFSAKVRTFLDAHGVAYERVEVDVFTKAELKDLPYRKVPQVLMDDGALTLVDSTEIVSILAPVFGQRLTPDVAKWRGWATDVLARLLVMNINSRLSDFPANVRYINSLEDLSAARKAKYLAAGSVMFLVAHMSTKKKLQNLGVDTSNPRKTVRQEMEKWCQATKKGDKPGALHGGTVPDVADTDVFGVTNSVRGHDLFDELSQVSACKEWFSAMEAHLQAHRVPRKVVAAVDAHADQPAQ